MKPAVETAGEEVLLVGSSLGGYYALWASTELDLRRVLINPLVNVAAQWPPSLPMEPKDLRFLDSPRPAEGWPARDTLALLDEGDTLLDRQVTLDELEGHAHVIMYPGGSHDFEHIEEAVEEIDRFSGVPKGADSRRGSGPDRRTVLD